MVKGGGRSGGGGVGTKKCKCNCGEFGYQISMLGLICYVSKVGGFRGNPTKNGETSFWLCMTFDLGRVLTKKSLSIFLAHYKISVKSTRQVLFY